MPQLDHTHRPSLLMLVIACQMYSEWPQVRPMYYFSVSSLRSTEYLCILKLGVYLKSKCNVYNINGSMIPISDIGEGDDALLCFTDLTDCCNKIYTVVSMPLGDWFYPNETRILSDAVIYRNRDRSVVRLHRRENTTEPHGQYCCKVPDATYRLVTLCINVTMSNSSESDNISSPTGASGNEYCEQTSTSTASQQPVTRIPLTIEG